MGEVFGKWLPQVHRFALQRLAGEDDVADEPGDRRERLDLRKGQDVGRFVEAPPLPVEFLLLGIVGEDDGELRNAGDLGLGVVQGPANRALGERLEVRGPALGIDGEGNRKRQIAGAQSDLS
jgi:hypothetical protein